MNKNILRIIIATIVILLIPLIAMQFTDKVDWTLLDFIIAGVLLFGTGLAYELTTRKINKGAYKIAIAVALSAALILIWIQLAVGIVGDHREGTPGRNVKINIAAVCQGALAYMTFASGDDANAFVAECVDGKHPEVIEKYKADMHLDGAQI